MTLAMSYEQAANLIGLLSAHSSLLIAPSNSFLRHHHRPDNRHQQQQGSDLEGEHVIAGCAMKSNPAMLGVVAFSNVSLPGRETECSLVVVVYTAINSAPSATAAASPTSHCLLNCSSFCVLLDIDQHDHEQEQHHDAARVKNDLDAGHERARRASGTAPPVPSSDTISARAECTAFLRVITSTPLRTVSADRK